MKNKKANMGMWGGLLSLAIVLALFGLILTITSDVQEDIRDDQQTTSLCGTNLTGGSGGVISTSGCPSYMVGNASLTAQLTLAQKQSTLVTAGIGIFILSLLIGGLALYKLF